MLSLIKWLIINFLILYYNFIMSVWNQCPTVPVLQNPHKRKTVSPTTTPPPGNILRKIQRFPFEPPPKFVGICGIFRADLVWSFRFVTQDHTRNSLLLRWLGRASPRLTVRRGIWESALGISRFWGWLPAPLPLRLSWMYRRVVHGSDGPAGRVGSGRVGSGRVGSRFCRILAGRVGSGQHFGFCSFLLIISYYHNRYESLNTTFELIYFLRYLLIFNN